ncbi:MAG: ABC transporter substrate-binding protein [Clostridia bacterium]|nr:ABC transporter substrate-binding protein [Clostridia bacterium]
MKKTFIKIVTVLLTLAILIPLASCSKKPDSELEINIYALNGTTALGMAQLIDSSNNDTDEMNYNITLHTAADAITGAIITGECDIAALPTNVAVKLFNKSEGKLKLLAVNTLGVLYLLQNGEQVSKLSDLEGKTVYVPGAGANPEYITAALIESAGIKNVTIDATTYNSPDALQAAIATNAVSLAVLPEPKVTATKAANPGVSVALDLTEEWEKINGDDTLVQGCLVVNTEFANEHPIEIAKFLEDYKASVDYISEGSDEAIEMITSAKILPNATIAKKALPNCNICFIAGEEMKPIMNTFCEKIFAYDNSSIGGKLPTDEFYYIEK